MKSAQIPNSRANTFKTDSDQCKRHAQPLLMEVETVEDFKEGNLAELFQILNVLNINSASLPLEISSLVHEHKDVISNYNNDDNKV